MFSITWEVLGNTEEFCVRLGRCVTSFRFVNLYQLSLVVIRLNGKMLLGGVGGGKREGLIESISLTRDVTDRGSH